MSPIQLIGGLLISEDDSSVSSLRAVQPALLSHVVVCLGPLKLLHLLKDYPAIARWVPALVQVCLAAYIQVRLIDVLLLQL